MAGSAPRRVLLIGKRARVLRRLAAALRETGIDAVVGRDVTGSDVGDLAGYGALALGRGVREPDRRRMAAAFSSADPDGVVIEGLAPITPLLVAQLEEALDRRPAGARRLGGLSVAGGAVAVELRTAARLRVTAHRLDRLVRASEVLLLDERRGPGAHVVPLDPRTARARRAFVVVRADHEVRVADAGG